MQETSPKFILDISWSSIAKIAVSLFLVLLIYRLSDLLILVLFSLVISMLFSPIIEFLEERRVPRSVSAVLTYGGFFLILGTLLYLYLPPLVLELQKITQLLPSYIEKVAPPFKELGLSSFGNFEEFINQIQSYLLASSKSVLTAIFSIFGGILSTLFVIFTGIFFSLEKRPIESVVSLLAPPEIEGEIVKILERAKTKISLWFLSRVLASLFIGFGCFIAFSYLNLEFAVSLSIVSAILNFLPYLGPFISGILIFVLPALKEPQLGFLALLAFVIVQQIENNAITPLLTKRFVGLSPVLTLVAFSIGASLWGVLGSILAIPMLAVGIEFLKGFSDLRKGKIPEEEGGVIKIPLQDLE